VDLLLYGEKVNQRVMDHAMGPMSVPVEQSAEGIFHRPCDCGKYVSFHRRELDDIHAHQCLGDEDAIGINLVQDEKRFTGLIFKPLKILFVKVNAWDVVFVSYESMFVIKLTYFCIHHNRIIMNANNVFIACIL